MPAHTHRAGRVPTPDTAFSGNGMHPKHPRRKNGGHLRFIRAQRCIGCGTRKDVQAAHIRAGSRAYAKRETGIGEKADDRWTLPLCANCHAEQHGGNEVRFWMRRGIDCYAKALALFNASCECDEEAADLIIEEALIASRSLANVKTEKS